MNKTKELLMTTLRLTEKEWDTLANYGYCDHFGMVGRDTVASWQNWMREAMMEEEGMEAELGEPIWQGNDKNILISILNR